MLSCSCSGKSGDVTGSQADVTGTLVAKIADFGMSRNITYGDYYRVANHFLLPVRWMSIEAIKMATFTKHSDIWSLGIVFWEIMTHCEMPYPGLGNSEILAWIEGGSRLSKPPACPDFLYDLCLGCWQPKPDERPSALQVTGHSYRPFIIVIIVQWGIIRFCVRGVGDRLATPGRARPRPRP